MTVREIINRSEKNLLNHHTDTPRLDITLLLAHTLKINRETLYARLGDSLDKQEIISFQEQLDRRIKGEPVAWITGVKEFWALNFQVGPGVLCPRPDSEILVETVLEFMGEKSSGTLHDCCCGPGTLAIALAVERKNWQISASDISITAEKYFHRNNRQLAGSRVSYIRSNLLEGVKDQFDIIIANPPYLTSTEVIERKAVDWREPDIALDGGEDGLDIFRCIIPQATKRLKPNGLLFLEANPLQMPVIRTILMANDFNKIETRCDLGNWERVIYSRYWGKS